MVRRKYVIMRKTKRVWVLKTIKPKTLLTFQQKEFIEKRCKEFIDSAFKAQAFKQFSSYENERELTDIYCKWRRDFFYFIAVIKDIRPNIIASEYEQRLARIEPKTHITFYLSYFRHTGEWFDISHGQGFTLKDCLKNILSLPHFFPV